MPQIAVNYVHNCDCDRRPNDQVVAYTEAIDTAATLRSGQLIDYFLFLTTRPYPLEMLDGIDASSALRAALFLTAPMDAIDSVATLQSGELRTALKTTEMADEAIDVDAVLVSGTLRVAFVGYEMADEAVDVVAELLAGSLRPVLVSTEMAD